MNNDIKNLFLVFRKEAKLIALVTLVMLGWGVIYSFTLYTPKYESKARLWIKALNPQASVNPELASQTINPLSPVAQAGNPILTQMEMLKSERISNALTEYVNKNYPAENPGGKPINVSKLLDLKNRVGTDIIEVNFTWRTPKLSQRFLNKILDTYQDTVSETNTTIRRKRREFIDHKIVEMESDLAKVNEQIRNFKRDNRVMAIPMEAQEMTTRRGELETTLAKVLMEKNGAYNKMNDLRKQLGLSTPYGIRNSIVSYDNAELVQLQNNLSNVMLDYLSKKETLADDNPKLVALKNQVDYLKHRIRTLNGAQINASLPTISDPVKSNIAQNMAESQSNYMSMSAQETSLRTALDKLQGQYEKMPENEYALSKLEETQMVLTNAYKALKTQQIDAHLNEAEVMSNIFEVDPPSLPEKPSPLTEVHYIVLSLFAGLALGIMAAIGKQQIQDSCDRVNEVESMTGKPVIGRLPWLKKKPDLAEASPLDSSYTQIISSLRVQSREKSLQTLVFTSPLSTAAREYSFVYGLANQLAGLDYKVALVDNDLRNPSILPKLAQQGTVAYTLSDALYTIEHNRIVHLQNGNGLKSNGYLQPLVTNGKHLEEANGAVNLLIHGNGKSNGNSHDLHQLGSISDYGYAASSNLNVFGNVESTNDPYKYFNSQAYGLFIEKLKEEYDWVIVDAPIDYSAPEFPIIAGLSDGVVLVANYQVKKSKLKEIMSLLQEWDVNFLGTIIREESSLSASAS